MNPKKTKGTTDEVRFNVYLPREAFDKLEQLKEMAGKRSLAETIRSALAYYMAIVPELADHNLILEHKTSKEREKLRLIESL